MCLLNNRKKKRTQTNFHKAGIGSDTLFLTALLFRAQTIGAPGGAMEIMEVVPPKYRMFKKVDNICIH